MLYAVACEESRMIAIGDEGLGRFQPAPLEWPMSTVSACAL